MQPLAKRTIQAGVPIRVLVVDDSVVIRNLVSHALKEDPDVEVVGTAAHGGIALSKIPQLNPDVVTLDVDMPVMDGLETLRRIRRQYPRIYVIMFSTLTSRGATTTLDALMSGANDYVTKASNSGSLDRSIAALRQELVPKIKQFFLPGDDSGGPLPPLPSIRITKSASGFRNRHSVVGIGVSTGGPAALATIVSMLPSGFSQPILIVQHMPPFFTTLLAERLQTRTSLLVEEAKHGRLVEPGTILIAPGDYHLSVRKSNGQISVVLGQTARQNSCRPSVDVLFQSLAEAYGSSTIAVVLTGMGQDGLRGAKLLKRNGAFVIAQDEASSVVWGMPGFVVKEGLADAVVPPEDVVPTVLRELSRGDE